MHSLSPSGILIDAGPHVTSMSCLGLAFLAQTCPQQSLPVDLSFFTKLSAGASRLPVKYLGTGMTTCLGEGPTSRLIQRRANNPPWRNFQPVTKVTLRTMVRRMSPDNNQLNPQLSCHLYKWLTCTFALKSLKYCER